MRRGFADRRAVALVPESQGLTRPFRSTAAPSLVALALAGCSHKGGNSAPPRVETAADLPSETSTIVVPVSAPLADLEAAINRETPTRLWQIDQHQDACVPAKHVNLGIAKVKVVPDLGCRIVGQVIRGPVTLAGSGSTLRLTMPVHATIAAQKVGGVVSKTATGAAVIHATARLSIAGDWRPVAKVTIDYDWSTPPGIDFLGKRIEFVDKADERLKPVIADLERSLPAQLAKLDLRDKLAGAWKQGFTSLQLNRDNPPAWMRITPKRLGFGGYRVTGRTLEMVLAAEAVTETFVGDRPADPAPTPLPPPSPSIGARGLQFFIPVLADYAQLEPVVQRTLRKRAAKGINLKGVGPVDAQFGKVTIYATTGGHLAVGVETRVKAQAHSWAATTGTIWLTAIPYNAPGSQLIRASDVQIASDTNSHVANLLVSLFNDTSVRDSIRDALSHDFVGDYQKVLGSAQKAIDAKREGDFVLSAKVNEVQNGQIKVTGKGLFLPVRAAGAASISYHPAR